MYVDLDQALVFLLVMVRMTGLLVTNPILGRSSVPVMVNTGFAFILSFLITSSMQLTPPQDPTFGTFIFMAMKELAVGMIISLIMQLFLSILVIAGENVDMQLGIGMAKIFDPGTNSSISLSSTWFNSMFILVFFATNNHLTLIKLATQTFNIIPVGAYTFNFDVALYLPQFMSTIFIYAVKLAMPIVVIEIIVTMAVGIIMRIIPQINIFVVNIQFKLIVGMLALVILVAPFMAFFENMIVICFEQIATALKMLAS